MKVYADTYNKDVKAYVLYADEDGLLYADEGCTIGVTADEIFNMFVTGILLVADGIYAAPEMLTPADSSTAYATLTFGETSFYTVEKE